MKRRAILATGLAALGVASCTRPRSKFLTYDGPAVTRVIVLKGQRRMYLLHDTQTLKAYDVALGFAPEGQKQFEGDGKTPEGDYLINRRNPASTYHLSLGISYPTPEQIAAARLVDRKPGGDIFIHGGPRPFNRPERDWTDGCIAVTDPEIEVVYAMVRDRTPVSIYA